MWATMSDRLDTTELMGDRLLTAAEVAALLGIKVSTVRQWTYQRRIPCVHLADGRAVRYLPSELRRLINKGRQAPRGRG
jgi:excisionase family DNA binding protein